MRREATETHAPHNGPLGFQQLKRLTLARPRNQFFGQEVSECG